MSGIISNRDVIRVTARSGRARIVLDQGRALKSLPENGPETARVTSLA